MLARRTFWTTFGHVAQARFLFLLVPSSRRIAFDQNLRSAAPPLGPFLFVRDDRSRHYRSWNYQAGWTIRLDLDDQRTESARCDDRQDLIEGQPLTTNAAGAVWQKTCDSISC